MESRHILTPNRDSRESCLAKNSIRVFLVANVKQPYAEYPAGPRAALQLMNLRKEHHVQNAYSVICVCPGHLSISDRQALINRINEVIKLNKNIINFMIKRS